jgi:maltooligosyltrehalose synthase
LDTSLAVPDGQAGQTYRNVFTGETVAALEGEQSVVLPLREIFASFPVALLELSS